MGIFWQGTRSHTFTSHNKFLICLQDLKLLELKDLGFVSLQGASRDAGTDVNGVSAEDLRLAPNSWSKQSIL